MRSSTTNKANPTDLDEFKYGFPSGGLSREAHKWWGNNNKVDGSSDSQQNNNKERNRQVEEDNAANLSSMNDDVSQCATSSLSALRKRAAEDGRRALKRGVYRRYEFKNLDRSKSNVLMKIFTASLPGDWSDVSLES